MVSRKVIESYKTGYLDVGQGYKIYYELYGNPNGKPALFFHGGPGEGFEDKHKRFFDPKVWNVILFDQRGAGKSTPFVSIKDNTTQHLIKDTKKLLVHLGIRKILLAGGSWGSALALLFAIEYSKMVNGMVLWGIFLADEEDIQYITNGGVNKFFPEVWKRFVANVPKKKRNDIVGYYLSQMTCGDEEVENKYAYEWTYYELCLLRLKLDEKAIRKELKNYSPKALAVFEAYYEKNRYFLSDNYILRNASKLSEIPITLIQGRYDFVCPPINAYKLHDKLGRSKLHVVTAGHSSSDRELNKKISEEVKRFGV